MAVAEQRRWQDGGAWATATEDWRRGPRRHRERKAAKAAKAHTAAEQDGDAAHIYRGGTGEEQERVMGEGRAREEGKQLNAADHPHASDGDEATTAATPNATDEPTPTPPHPAARRTAGH